MGTQTETNPSATEAKKKSLKKLYIILGSIGALIVLVLLWLFVVSPAQKNNGNQALLAPSGVQNQLSQNQPIGTGSVSSSETLVYGSWTGQNSVIKTLDLTSNEEGIVATLPITIKKVSVLDSSRLIYIDQTDQQDHGKQLVIYNIKSKQPSTVIPAANGFGIDDYVLSPDKKYLATWEVAFAPGSPVLEGGQSRVYVINLSQPQNPQLLYDEVASPTNPVHYPRAVLDNGEVFSDRFLPNDPAGGTGWAYGMSMASFDGKTKQDLPEMQNGTYGTQPGLSPDGKYLAFAGYDGSRGAGTGIASGYRQAILTPNTIELLNTSSLQRQKIASFSNSNIYQNVLWDQQTGNLVITIISKNDSETGTYVYNLASSTLAKVSFPDNGVTTPSLLTLLPDKKMVIGFPDGYASSLGNLGGSYASSLREVDLFGGSPAVKMRLNISDIYSQYITVLPMNYFQGVLGIQTTAQNVATSPQPSSATGNTDTAAAPMQLYTFFVKTVLDPNRELQQSTATGAANGGNNGLAECRTLSNAQCLAQGLTIDTKAYGHCVSQSLKNGGGAGNTAPVSGAPSAMPGSSGGSSSGSSGSGGSSGSQICADSPLYLYSDVPGKQIHVTIQTPASNALPAYPQNGYDVTVLPDGKMQVGSNIYTSIGYDYLPNAVVKMPSTER